MAESQGIPSAHVNAVRNILMNELGLTRESIRGEMERIVKSTIEAHIARINIHDSIVREIDKFLATAPYDKPKLMELVKVCATSQLRSYIEDHIQLEVKITPAVPAQSVST